MKLTNKAADHFSSDPDEGTHPWLLRGARYAKDYLGFDREAAFSLLREHCDIRVKHRPVPVPDAEIYRILDLIFTESESPHLSAPPWPPFNPAYAREMAAAFPKPAFSVQRPLALQTADVLPALFGASELVCISTAIDDAKVMPLDSILHEACKFQFICPNPMSKPLGIGQTGKLWYKTKDNTCRRRFLVIEFDREETPLEMQASILIALATKMRLVLVVFSGRKSLHGWFLVENIRYAQVAEFFYEAVSLGADRALWCRSQWTRMPAGIRPGNPPVRQSILYFHLPTHP